MKYKTALIRADWDRGADQFDGVAVKRLRLLVQWIDIFCQMVGWGEITITSYYRPESTNSYHSVGQAVDIRTRDKPDNFKYVMMAFRYTIRAIDKQLWINPHKELWGEPQEHIHVAIEDGKIARNR